MESNTMTKDLTFSNIERILVEHKLSHTDLDKLKRMKFDGISNITKEILQNIGITSEAIENALCESNTNSKQAVSKEYEKSGKREDVSKKNEEKGSEAPPTNRELIENFLRHRSLSQSFITSFFKIGFTEEIQRFMHAMGFTCEDTEELRRLWDLEIKGRVEIDSFASVPSSSNEYLSSDGLYLKYSLSKPLSHAIREIVAKKPFDPIEYLAHWLLNFKICEEREKIRKEFELELMIERERVKRSVGEEKIPLSVQDEDEEEEFIDNWSFLTDE